MSVAVERRTLQRIALLGKTSVISVNHFLRPDKILREKLLCVFIESLKSIFDQKKSNVERAVVACPNKSVPSILVLPLQLGSVGKRLLHH